MSVLGLWPGRRHLAAVALLALLLPSLLLPAQDLPAQQLPANQMPANQMRVTNEAHIDQGPKRTFFPRGAFRPQPTGGPDTSLPPRPTNSLLGSNLLFEKAEGRPRDLDFDVDLSRNCRRGLLRQIQDRLFIAKLGGVTYGAGLGGHASLHDPKGLAQAGYLYVIQDQDTARCRVYRGEFLGFPGTAGQ